MKYFFALLLVLSSCAATQLPRPAVHDGIDIRPECNVSWFGEIDEGFATKVREDLFKAHKAQCKPFQAALMSPGGSVIWSVEASQEIKRARINGLVVAIHGRSLVASGALAVISAGSPGHRFIARNSLIVVHAMRRSGGFGEPPICIDFNTIAGKNDEEAKILRALLFMDITEVVENTGKPWLTVASWFTCGNEQAGPGKLLVQLGLADQEEN